MLGLQIHPSQQVLEARVAGATGPLWEKFTVEGMSKDVGLQYHPGSSRFYQEKSVLPDSKYDQTESK